MLTEEAKNEKIKADLMLAANAETKVKEAFDSGFANEKQQEWHKGWYFQAFQLGRRAFAELTNIKAKVLRVSQLAVKPAEADAETVAVLKDPKIFAHDETNDEDNKTNEGEGTTIGA